MNEEQILQLIAQTVATALQQVGASQGQTNQQGSIGVGGGQGQAMGGGGGRRLIDTKAVKIRDFDGSQSTWEPWVHSFKSAMRSACPEILKAMEEAEKTSLDAKDENFEEYDDVARMSSELYNVLSQYCTGEALTVVKGVTTFEGLWAWQKLHRKFNPKTMARAIRLMTEVAGPRPVKDIREVDDAITNWEMKVKKLEAEFGEKLSSTMKVAVVTGMMPNSIQDYVYTNVDENTQYSAVIGRIRSWAENKVAMMSGPTPMDVGEVQGESWDENGGDWEDTEIQAVGPNTQCHRCGGWGHMARECATYPGKAKGKGKDSNKGKGKGFAKGGKGAAGKGGEFKGKGKGYQGTCWTCGNVGHKSNECSMHRQANSIEEAGSEEIEIGGVWMIGQVNAEVEVPPGLDGSWKRVGKKGRPFNENRYQVLSDDGADEVEESPGGGGWRMMRKVKVGIGAVGVGTNRPKMSRESGMRFNVAKVQKPLASAAKVVEAGNKISMGPNPGDNYIENAATGERIGLRVERGTYVFDVEYTDGEVGVITLDSGAGVNVWPEDVQKNVPMLPRDPRLRMTAANGSEIQNLGTKVIKFRGVEPDFSRRV